MKNIQLRNELQEIKTLKDAELVAAKLVYMLNQVAKTIANDDTNFCTHVYNLKSSMLRYFEEHGFLKDRQNDSETTALLTFDIHGIKISLHEKRYSSKNYKDFASKLFPKTNKDYLSNNIDLWTEDRKEMIFALEHIITSLPQLIEQ